MPGIHTTYFGELEYTEGTVFHFPYGLPGFEHERAFLFLKQPHTDPLLFLQSLGDPKLCFILVPILVVDENYKVNVDAEDLAALHLPPDRQPRIGEDILCAAIVSTAEGEAPEVTRPRTKLRTWVASATLSSEALSVELSTWPPVSA